MVSSTVPTETDSTPVGRVRIGDVALLAETSVSTVSNYLNGRATAWRRRRLPGSGK